MPSRNSREDSDEMSEEQRLTLLERSVTTNKIVLLVMALGLIVAISVTITTLIMAGMKDDTPTVELTAFNQLQMEVMSLKKQLVEQEKYIANVQQSFPKLQEQIKNSSAGTFQRVMIQQEKGNQKFLKTLKSGMYDLAHMVPGSRTWLELYNEQMNEAMQLSLQRERELKRLQTGEVLVEPDF